METVQFIGEQVVGMLAILLQVYSYVIFIRVILSWFVPPNSSMMQFLVFLTEPVLGPIRKMMEPLMRKSAIPLDVSPIIAFVLLSIIGQILTEIF